MLILEINLWFSQIDEILVQMWSICSLNFEPWHYACIRFSLDFLNWLWLWLGLDLRDSNFDSDSRFEDSNTSLMETHVVNIM